MAIIPENRLKRTLSAGRVAIGTMLVEFRQASLLIVQVETREALDNLDDILRVPGVDAALVGPTDLSIALEVPGRMRDPILGAAIERVRQTFYRVGPHPEIYTNDVALTAEW